ncbi:MAG: hypothetical protein R2746_04430 [Acidimicrobiales bacterium]
MAFTVTADERDVRRYLGPWADQFLVFVDPKRTFVEAAELERLPALVYVRQDLAIVGKAEGWEPSEWEHVGASWARSTPGAIRSCPRPATPVPSAALPRAEPPPAGSADPALVSAST